VPGCGVVWPAHLLPGIALLIFRWRPPPPGQRHGSGAEARAISVVRKPRGGPCQGVMRVMALRLADRKRMRENLLTSLESLFTARYGDSPPAPGSSAARACQCSTPGPVKPLGWK